MDPARWNEISRLAAAAAETGGAEREALLAAHPELRAEVESLLTFLDEGSGPLDAPLPLAAEPADPGRRIGPYEILRELGRGGMGVVYLARRSGAGFEQTVALKLAQAAFQSEFFLRRFLDERQILARLEHPNIARLLDGGVTTDGAPYLVIQYVEGVPLDAWCHSRGASLNERLALFLKICAAVEYAHEHLVVHRDLKPANILVTPAGEPMLLDFGTARLIEDTAPSGTTRTAAPMLTLRYASPEQVRGLAGATRSDVYSLGVILYELLTGCWPYPLGSDGLPAQLRAIAEADPITPSRAQTSLARRRELRGDLDSILLKALDKDPARRYGAAAQFADDLRRALRREPVLARPLTWRYRAGRFLLRHRWAATAAALVLLTLSGATAYSLRQARIADRERIKAEQVAMFVERLMGASRSGQVSPLARRGRDLKVVELVDEAGRTVGDEFKDRPEVEAGLRSTIASTYLAMGLRAEAAPHVEQAVRLAESVYGPNHPATARAWNARGRLRLASGEYEGAVNDFRAAARVLESVRSPDLPFAQSLLGEALYRTADLAGARQQIEASLAGMRQQFGENHVATSTLINNLAVITDDLGDFAASERYFGEAANVLRAQPGPPGNLVYPLVGLQRFHLFRGEYAQAKALCEEAHRVTLAAGGPNHPNTAVALTVLALVKAHLGESDAEPLARQAVAIQRAAYPAGHIEISRALTFLGRVLLKTGDARGAESVLREALDIARKVFPKPNWRPAESQAFLAAALAAQGRAAEAAPLFDSAAEMAEVLPATHPRLAELRSLR